MPHKTGIAIGINRASPPAASYWIGQDRGALKALIAGRRAQQRTPTVSELIRDPMLAATVALTKDHRPRWKSA